MFGVNIEKLIERKFYFLTSHGFTTKNSLIRCEVEFYYSNDCYEINVSHYPGIDDNYHHKNIVSVAIEGIGLKERPLYEILKNLPERENLLNCDRLFGKEKLDALKLQLSEKKASDQIAIYADFISENIEKLL